MTATFSAAEPARYTLHSDDLLTAPAVAELLGCDSQTVARLIEGGYLPTMRVGPEHRVHAAELTAFCTQYGHHEPAAVAEGGCLPTFTPRPLRLVTHHSGRGLLLVTPYKPPVGLDDEPAAVKGRTG